ncbi:MAG: hypothetical protein H6719_00985 [Sandaracinaceae bacterium]|nr:hypothetical protein [Sandaracinaceae bacterium]
MKAIDVGVALAVWGTLTLASPAMADDDGLVDLELTIPVGIADRSATGTGDDLAGFGYDDQTGLMTGAELRLYSTGFNRYARVGVVAGAQHHAGPLLGAVDGYAFRTTVVDAGIGVRTLFPCMSDASTRWHLSGVLGLSGIYADAGEGVGGTPNGPRYAERVAASRRLDHGGLGWRLAVDLSVHLESFIIGLGVGVRQYFGIDAAVSRGWLMDVGLRIGGRIDFMDPRNSV